MEKDEVDFLTNKHRDIAEHYTRRFIDYMSFHNANFPEYNAATNEDVYPDKMRPSTDGNSKRYQPKEVNLKRLKKLIKKIREWELMKRATAQYTDKLGGVLAMPLLIKLVGGAAMFYILDPAQLRKMQRLMEVK